MSEPWEDFASGFVGLRPDKPDGVATATERPPWEDFALAGSPGSYIEDQQGRRVTPGRGTSYVAQPATGRAVFFEPEEVGAARTRESVVPGFPEEVRGQRSEVSRRPLVAPEARPIEQRPLPLGPGLRGPPAVTGVTQNVPWMAEADLGARPPPPARVPLLKARGIAGDVARTAVSAGAVLAEKGAQIVGGLEETAESITGLPQAIRNRAFTFLWQAFPDQMQEFQASRATPPTQPLAESRLQQIRGQGEQIAGGFMTAVEETHREALDEIRKQGGIPAYVAQQIGEGALSLAVDLAMLKGISGAQPGELTGTISRMREAALQNAKISTAVYASTPGTPEEKLNSAMRTAAYLGAPTAASQLTRTWMAKTAAVLALAGLNTENYVKGLQSAHQQAEASGRPEDWPKYAIATIGVQGMTDLMFGILTQGKKDINAQDWIRQVRAKSDVLADEAWVRNRQTILYRSRHGTPTEKASAFEELRKMDVGIVSPEAAPAAEARRAEGLLPVQGGLYDQASQRGMEGIVGRGAEPGRAVPEPGAGAGAVARGGVLQAPPFARAATGGRPVPAPVPGGIRGAAPGQIGRPPVAPGAMGGRGVAVGAVGPPAAGLAPIAPELMTREVSLEDRVVWLGPKQIRNAAKELMLHGLSVGEIENYLTGKIKASDLIPRSPPEAKEDWYNLLAEIEIRRDAFFKRPLKVSELEYYKTAPPPGYVREGDRYVFKPAPEVPAAAAEWPIERITARLQELGIPADAAPRTAAAVQKVLQTGDLTGGILDPRNNNARGLFVEITGVMLPKTIKGTKAAVAEWYAGKAAAVSGVPAGQAGRGAEVAGAPVPITAAQAADQKESVKRIKASTGFPKAQPLVTVMGKAIPKRMTLPVLATMHVQDGVGMATDLETTVRMKSVLKNGLYEKVGTEFVRSSIEPEEFPPAPALTGERAMIRFPDGPALLDALKKVGMAQSEDETRHVLMHTLFEVGEGGIWLVATDGRRLTRSFVQGDTGGLKVGERYIVRSGTTEMLQADKAAPAWQMNVEVEAKETGGLIRIENGNMEVTGKLMDGTYPNFRQVIPAQQDVSWTVDKEKVLAALKQLKPFLKKQKNPQIALEIVQGKLSIRNISEEKEYARTIEVPVEVGGLMKPADSMTILMPLKTEGGPAPEVKEGEKPVAAVAPHITLNPDFFADALNAVGEAQVKLGVGAGEDRYLTPMIIQGAMLPAAREEVRAAEVSPLRPAPEGQGGQPEKKRGRKAGKAMAAPEEELRVGREGITPEQDAIYLDAVNRGDTATMQRMVDEAAKKAGYNVGPIDDLYIRTKAHIPDKPSGALLDAWKLGQEVARAGERHGFETIYITGTTIDHTTLESELRDVGEENLADRLAEYYEKSDDAPGEFAAYKDGLRSADESWDIPEFRVAWRYSLPPESGASFNYRDQEIQDGVSTVALLTIKNQTGEGTADWYHAGGADASVKWKKIFIGGWYFGARGSDGEPLLSQPVVLTQDIRDIKSANSLTRDSADNVIPLSRRFDTGEALEGTSMPGKPAPKGKKAGAAMAAPEEELAIPMPGRPEEGAPAVAGPAEQVRPPPVAAGLTEIGAEYGKAAPALPPEDDPGYSVFPLELPEMVRLAKTLTGKYPVVRRRGMRGAAGLYQGGGKPGEGQQISILASLYDRVTKFEKAMKLMELSGLAREEGLALSDPGTRAGIKAEYEAWLAQKREERKDMPPVFALKTLAHEIGHAKDYEPLEDVKGRGNIFAHIGSLADYIKQSFPKKPGDDMGLLPETRRKLRNEAQREARAELGKQAEKEEVAARTKEIYAGLISDKMAEEGLATYEELMTELKPMIAWWHGAETIPEYYDSDPSEMYAEALSVWLNNPAAAQKRAPAFNAMLYAYMERKPEFKAAYEKVMDLIGRSAVYEERDRIMTMEMKQANKDVQAWLELQHTRTWRERKDLMRRQIDRQLGPIQQRVVALMSKPILKQMQAAAVDRARGELGTDAQPAAVDALAARHYAEAVEGVKNTMWAALGGMDRFLYRQTMQWGADERMRQEVLIPLAQAGKTVTELDKFLFHKRVVEDEPRIGDVAQPWGFERHSSQAMLDEMRTRDPEGFAQLETIQKQMRTVYQEEALDRLRHYKIFSEEMIDDLDRRTAYATWQVSRKGAPPGDPLRAMLESRYGKGVTSHIYKQYGTHMPVASPYMATTSKMLRLISMAERENMKRTTIQALTAPDSPFKAEWEPAKSVYIPGKGRQIQIVDTDRVGTLTIMREGKLQGWYGPRVLVDALSFGSPNEMNMLVNGMFAVLNVQKSLLTRWNPTFIPRAWWRDVRGFNQRMPGTAGDWLNWMPLTGGAYTRFARSSLVAAATLYADRPNALAQDALRRGVMIAKRQGYMTMGMQGEIVMPDLSNRGAIRRWASALGNAGQILEATSKINGMQYMDWKFPDMPEAQKMSAVHSWAGSPNFLERMEAARLVEWARFFAGPWKEGWRSTGWAWFGGGGWKARPWEQAMNFFRRSILTALGIYMLYGGGLKRVLEGLGIRNPGLSTDAEQQYADGPSDFEKSRNFNIPLGWYNQAEHKVWYLTLPLEESERNFMTMLRTGAAAAFGAGGPGQTERLNELAGYLSGDLPGINPITAMIGNWLMFIGGGTPYDTFRMRKALTPDQERLRWTEGLKAMAWFTANQMGGSIVGQLRPETAEDLPKSAVEQIIARTPGLRGLIKISDNGFKERFRKSTMSVLDQQAEIRTEIERTGIRLRRGGKLTVEEVSRVQDGYTIGRQAGKQILSSEQELKRYYYTHFDYAMKEAQIPYLSPEARVIIRQPSRAAQAAVLEEMIRTRPPGRQ